MKRIDYALERVDMTRGQLARALGLSPQAISSLGRRKNARLKHSNIEKAAQVLRCDFEWLATGIGQYKPATAAHVPDLSRPTEEFDAEDRAAGWPARVLVSQDEFVMVLHMRKCETERQRVIAYKFMAKLSAGDIPTITWLASKDDNQR